MWNLPNILTLMRIALIPVFIAVYYTSWEWHNLLAAAIFGLAAATDWVDGYVARKYNQVTPFGAFLDPVADKLIVVAAMVMLLEQYSTPWFALPAVVIIGREIIISALREWMAEIGKRASVAVSWVGKVKTLTQMFALWVLIWRYDDWMIWLGYISIYVATVLTYWSMVQYLAAAKDDLLNEEHH